MTKPKIREEIKNWARGSVVLILSFGFVACSTAPPEGFDKKYLYKRNLIIQVNGKEFVGTGVVPMAPGYKMRFKTPSGFDLAYIVVRTCSGEESRFGEDENVPWEFTPRPSMDLKRACPVEVKGVSKDRAKRVYGWIDFEMPRHELNSQVYCNWKQAPAHGVSACETAMGLLTRIEFPGPTRVDTSKDRQPQCDVISGEAQFFEFKVPRGECTFIFWDGKQSHRFSTFGYERVLTEDL